MQQPQPHGIAADESKGDLLEEESAQRDPAGLLQGAVAAQSPENELQPQASDDGGLDNQENKSHRRRENADLVQVSQQKGEVDLRDDDDDCNGGDCRLADSDQEGT